MNKNIIRYFLILVSLLFMTGCWDSRELNDRVIWLASGWDAEEDKKIKISAQVIIPSTMQPEANNSGPTFFTLTGSGLNVGEALQNLQTKLSREAFFSQRKAIFLGEDLAKRGIKKELDATIRGADVSLLADIFIIKNGTAEDILKLSYPLENIPANAASKEYKQLSGKQYTSFLHFLIAANSDGIRPTIPVIEINGTESKESLFQLAGVAIFDENLKLIDYLNVDEDRLLLWILGRLKQNTIPMTLNDKNNISLLLNKLDSKITPTIKNDKISFNITLTGEGDITENNSNLDIFITKNLNYVKKKLEEKVKKDTAQLIAKVQEEYRLDIFGLGETIHKKYPQQWKLLKKDWDKTFSEAEISVHAHFEIKQIGLTGPPLLYEESEIKK
ncbi:Ger(x)C family spore germination protein [Metabacillus fastidiosus]|uniref:Ger(x)C family spore germination protein n=1 Tax=Metabacillus fastidiosus TaxID=1458 RepID=UPI003D2CD22F